MMRLVVVLGVLGVVTACGASSKRVNGPDGQGEWYSISCRRSIANCEEEAGNVCPRGYDTSRADVAGPSRAPAGLEAAGEMMVKCK